MNFNSPAGFLRVALCATVAALSAAAVSAQPAAPESARPFGASQRLADQYIVVFKNHVTSPRAEAASAVASAGGQVHFTYTVAIKGFSATLPAPALAALQNNPNVAYIEQDQTVSLSEDQLSATWGLDRVDQRALPVNSTYQYLYTGFGINAFIIDTGIRADHVEFTNRMKPGYNTVSSNTADTNDCNGHGTHVAGTVGGTKYGIAKEVSLTPVRVLNCQGSGTWSGVIAGIDWVAGSALPNKVANMSLGGGFSASVNQAVAGAVTKGVTMAVAAGNDSADACNSSPASEPTAITVGATTSTDARASYSNYGTCVDIFAPGSSITSSWHTSSTATNTISGTSMAAPHVAGIAALIAQANPGATPATIGSILTSNATANKVTSAGTGSPNLLAYSLGTSGTTVTTQLVGVSDIATNSFFTGKGARVKSWQAQATVKVTDSNGAAVGNATVTGSFTPGVSGSCVTASTGDNIGKCTLSSGNLSLSEKATKFSVNGVSGTNMTFNGQQPWVMIYPPPQ